MFILQSPGMIQDPLKKSSLWLIALERQTAGMDTKNRSAYVLFSHTRTAADVENSLNTGISCSQQKPCVIGDI